MAAQDNARRQKVEHLVSFEIQDYSETKFPDSIFDVVWAIESLCHAEDKEKLFTELKRVLKPNGRLIVADSFQSRAMLTSKEQKISDQFFKGFAVYKTQYWDQLRQELEKTGFRNIRFWNKTEAISKSSRYILFLCLIFAPAALIVSIIHIFRPSLTTDVLLGNWRASFAQWSALRKGLWIYGVYYADK